MPALVPETARFFARHGPDFALLPRLGNDPGGGDTRGDEAEARDNSNSGSGSGGGGGGGGGEARACNASGSAGAPTPKAPLSAFVSDPNDRDYVERLKVRDKRRARVAYL